MPKLIGYAPAGLIYTPRSNSWSLRAGFNRAKHCVDFEIRCGSTRFGSLLHRNGEGISDRLGLSSDTYEIEGAGGETIYIDKIEADGMFVGYRSTAPLQPGLTYAHIQTWEPAADAVPMAHLKVGPAFGSDTLITTDKGDMPVQWLSRGTKVLTRDNGFKPLRWLGRTQISPLNVRCTPQCAPVRIALRRLHPEALAGFMDVSPETGLLVCRPDVKKLFDDDEVLVPAKSLAEQKQPARADQSCTLHHLLFVDHQVVRANGLWSESLFVPSPEQRDQTGFGIYPPRGVFHPNRARKYLTQEQAGVLLKQRAVDVRSDGCLHA